jgi:hypothetical protein
LLYIDDEPKPSEVIDDISVRHFEPLTSFLHGLPLFSNTAKAAVKRDLIQYWSIAELMAPYGGRVKLRAAPGPKKWPQFEGRTGAGSVRLL